jgi:hypothetical protein
MFPVTACSKLNQKLEMSDTKHCEIIEAADTVSRHLENLGSIETQR